MRPRPRPGTREGMTAASGTARPGTPPWDGPRTTKHARTALAPFPSRQIIGHPAGHLKAPPAPPPAAGLRPVLDLPVRAAPNMAATRETGDPSHARPKQPPPTQTPL